MRHLTEINERKKRAAAENDYLMWMSLKDGFPTISRRRPGAADLSIDPPARINCDLAN